jgi:hypothetical protein
LPQIEQNQSINQDTYTQKVYLPETRCSFCPLLQTACIPSRRPGGACSGLSGFRTSRTGRGGGGAVETWRRAVGKLRRCGAPGRSQTESCVQTEGSRACKTVNRCTWEVRDPLAPVTMDPRRIHGVCAATAHPQETCRIESADLAKLRSGFVNIWIATTDY